MTTVGPSVRLLYPASGPADTSAVLSASHLFAGLSRDALDEIVEEMELVHLASGEILFRAGDRGDSLYVILHGRLRVFVTDRDGRESVVREAGRGENVGEFALLTGNPRSATVQVVRDTVLARLSRESFLRLAEKYPTTMVHLTRMLASWLAETNHRRVPSGALASTVAILPHDRTLPTSAFCEKLARALGPFGATAVVSARTVDAALGRGSAQLSEHDPGHDTVARWLDAQEAQHRFLIYEADPDPSAWSHRCLRQADRAMHLASGRQRPAPTAADEWLAKAFDRNTAREELVLLRDGAAPQQTRDWLTLRHYSRHHHVRFDRASDFQRLARHLAGRAIGLVLGGGGARGFAHIGVIRALQEAGVPIDRVGGTSMGAVIAAQYAQGLDYLDMLEVNRENWVRVQPLHDYTLPLIALLSGRKGIRMLEAMFGDTRIEDLPTNYYCVSTNLTRAESTIHRDGLLRDCVRASISIPGIAPPFVTESGELLVDGGVLNGIPADAMHHPDTGLVIAVDVSPRVDLSMGDRTLPSPWRALWQSIRRSTKVPPFPTIFKIMQRTAHLRTLRLANDLRGRVDLYLEPPVGDYDLFGWKALDAIAETGYQATRHTIEAWRSRQSVLRDDSRLREIPPQLDERLAGCA
jgi:predicted acylesterase/phospholipase RssA/CRP-like cAMP-binding protein